jgi:prophage regulatory protein
MKPSYRLVRLAEGMARTGLGRSAFYAAVSEGVLPKPVKLGRASAWPEHEINAVVAAMIRGDSHDALRDLVQTGATYQITFQRDRNETETGHRGRRGCLKGNIAGDPSSGAICSLFRSSGVEPSP